VDHTLSLTQRCLAEAMDIHHITKKEVHYIEFALNASEDLVLLEDLEAFIQRLRDNAFVGKDKISIVGAKVNERAHLFAKRSVLYDNLEHRRDVPSP